MSVGHDTYSLNPHFIHKTLCLSSNQDPTSGNTNRGPVFANHMLQSILQPSKITARDSMTSASTAILVLFDGAIFSTIVIAFAFEITRMTAGTEWRVL